MIAAWILAGVLALDVCDACRVADTKVILCAPHASAEKTALTSCGKGLRAKDEKQRIAALEELARATDAHTNAPSPRIVEMLRRGTKDESFTVRKRAVELLGAPQHGPAALDALVDALREYDKEMRAAFDDLRKGGLEPIDPKKPAKKQHEDMKEATLKLMTATERVERLRELGGVVAAQLERFPDDDSVEALSESICAALAVGWHRSLLALGSRSAVRSLLARMESSQKSRETRPESSREGATLELRELHDSLAAFAAARGLPVAEWSPEDPTGRWKAWLSEHGSALPEHLPGVHSPAW
jgi:hypothetical protein